eukprot:335193-Rhodomonas_salina.3
MSGTDIAYAVRFQYEMSGTDLAYGLRTRSCVARSGYPPTPLLRDVRYSHRVCRYQEFDDIMAVSQTAFVLVQVPTPYRPTQIWEAA